MQYFDRHEGGEKAILVHMALYEPNTNATGNNTTGNKESNNDLDEFSLLAQSADAEILATITGKLSRPFAKYFVGTGKAEEIAQQVANLGADIVLFNHSLTPSQERNLEKLCQCRVVDRTGLILDIFAKRAKTHEGKLQVELAQLNHLSTRLVRGWTHLERQKGGIGLRGPGETQLETDRRLLQIRIGQLKAKLAKVKQTRKQGRAKRQKSDTPTLSLVGYTNAGKSTLFNRLADEHIYAADQLFATLDPTLRRVHWQGLGNVVLADTVGFVKNLPHELVESFHATLEETLEADLLLHVIDSASPNMLDEIQAVNDVLTTIDADAPILLVYNKIDKSQMGENEVSHTTEINHTIKVYYADSDTPQRVFVSAKTGAGIDSLKQAVSEILGGQILHYTLCLSPNNRALISELYALGHRINSTYDEQGNTYIDITTTPATITKLLGRYNIIPSDVLPPSQANTLLDSDQTINTEQ